MLNFVTLFAGLSLVFALSTVAAAPPLLVIVAAATLSTAFAARAGGAGSAFAQAPRALLSFLLHAPATLRAAWTTLRAALAADIALKPALVRERAASDEGVSMHAKAGAIVVSVERDGALLHVLDEGRIHPGGVNALPRRGSINGALP